MSKSNKTEVEHYDNFNSLTTANLHLRQYLFYDSQQ